MVAHGALDSAADQKAIQTIGQVAAIEPVGPLLYTPVPHPARHARLRGTAKRRRGGALAWVWADQTSA